MKPLILAFLVVSVAALSFNKAPPLQAAGGVGYGVDFSQPASVQQFQCLAQAGYSVAFVRAYNPYGQGAYDPYACTNIHNAYPCLGVEIYMTPQPFSTKQGYQQFDEMINGLNNNGILVRSAWIQVVSPANWSQNCQQNINFIQGILNRARQRNIIPGIYTSQRDWTTITGNWNGAGSDVMLWYWNVNGGGPNGETPASFGDFVPFGSWQFPTVKQFAQVESVCSLTVNRDVFATSTAVHSAISKAAKEEKPEKYVVGNLGF